MTAVGVRCEWPDCTKRARIQTSLSGSGAAHRFCFRHTFMFLKAQIKQLGQYDFGVYLQPVKTDFVPHVIAPEARHAVTTPEDRAERAGEEHSLSGWDF